MASEVKYSTSTLQVSAHRGMVEVPDPVGVVSVERRNVDYITDEERIRTSRFEELINRTDVIKIEIIQRYNGHDVYLRFYVWLGSSPKTFYEDDGNAADVWPVVAIKTERPKLVALNWKLPFVDGEEVKNSISNITFRTNMKSPGVCVLERVGAPPPSTTRGLLCTDAMCRFPINETACIICKAQDNKDTEPVCGDHTRYHCARIHGKTPDGLLDTCRYCPVVIDPKKEQKCIQCGNKYCDVACLVNHGRYMACIDPITKAKIKYDECASCRTVKLTKHLKRCARCQDSMYCNLVCQKSHWNLHKTRCKKSHNWKPAHPLASVQDILAESSDVPNPTDALKRIQDLLALGRYQTQVTEGKRYGVASVNGQVFVDPHGGGGSSLHQDSHTIGTAIKANPIDGGDILLGEVQSGASSWQAAVVRDIEIPGTQ